MADLVTLQTLKRRVDETTGADRDLDRALVEAIYGWTFTSLSRIGTFARTEFWREATPGGTVKHYVTPKLTSDLGDALEAVEAALPGIWWHFAKGRMRNAEPLYGIGLLFGSDETIAQAEHEDRQRCVLSALLSALMSQAAVKADGIAAARPLGIGQREMGMGDVLATVLAYLEGQAPTTKSSGVVNSDLRRAIAAFLAGHDLTADLLAFVLRCSAENPASIGKKQSEAVTLLERHGIKPREYGLFFHSEEADVEDAAALLSGSGRGKKEAAAMREIDAALKDLNEALAAIGGCGDGGCVIVKPKGMHTNGGCRCPANRLQMARFAYAHNRFADAVRTASAAAQEPAAPRVRKLDWRELHMERSEADPSTEVVGFEARASSGSYYVIDIDDDVFDLTHDHTTVGIFYTEHEAKAAAQQDFARRIMSALTLPAEGCDSAAAAQSSSETDAP